MPRTFMIGSIADRLTSVRWLRVVAIIEGATLLVLLGFAVPLKHFAGLPIGVSIMGPIHGAAFLLYIWMVFNSTFSEDWSKGEIARLLIGALVPFGALLSVTFLKKRKLHLQASLADARTR